MEGTVVELVNCFRAEEGLLQLGVEPWVPWEWSPFGRDVGEGAAIGSSLSPFMVTARPLLAGSCSEGTLSTIVVVIGVKIAHKYAQNSRSPLQAPNSDGRQNAFSADIVR